MKPSPEDKRPAGVGRPRKSDGQSVETASRILDSAEELFSRNGFYGVSVRAVADHAGVNTALAHYYFQTKQGLFDAVFLRRAEIINRDRFESMENYERTFGDKMTVTGLIESFLLPLLNRALHSDPGWKNYFSILAQMANSRDLGTDTMTRYFDPLVQRLIDTLHKIMPDARKEDLYWSYHMLTGALTLTLGDTARLDRLSGGLCRSSDIDAIAPRMVEYCAAGFLAVCRRAAPAA
jgi:AcrR family transcriptional regulator